jgi:hypothetical protein
MNRQATGSAAARLFLAGTVIGVALCWAALARAQATGQEHDIDIAALPLSEALEQFAKQTELQYTYLPTDDAEEQTPVGPVKGHLTVDDALTRLLPAGFTFQWVNDRTISIAPPPTIVPPGDVKEAAAAKDQQHSELSKEQQLSMANGRVQSGSARGPYEFDWRVTVEGQRIFDSVFDSLDLDIPAQVFDREDIDASGASTVTDIFRLVTQQPNLKPGSFL